MDEERTLARDMTSFRPEEGQSRRAWKRLLGGRGQYVDDIHRPRMLHAAFLRSPFAHARVNSVHIEKASSLDGVAGVYTALDLDKVCKSWTAVHTGYPGHKSPPQHALAGGFVHYQGEPVVLVVATSRAIAEDAVELIEADWTPLATVSDPSTAAGKEAPVVHDLLMDNIGFSTTINQGDFDRAARTAAVVVAREFRFSRQTGVSLEPRSIIAEFESLDAHLTVFHSHQSPFLIQDILANFLDLPEHKIRVICPDVGGAFGLKQQLYCDELAVCAAALLVGRPIKFIADRTESFISDIHAREHVIRAKMAAAADGRILGFEIDDLFGVGAYSQYPRTSVGEGNLVVRFAGAAYRIENYHAHLRMVYQNKPIAANYRAVGLPIAASVTEALVEEASQRLGLDPIDMRLLNVVRDADLPFAAATGVMVDHAPFETALLRLREAWDLHGLRREHDQLRSQGIFRGIGVACYVELSAPGSVFYGGGGVRVSAQDSCIVRLEPTGVIRCISSVTEQGQGTSEGIAQLVAEAFGVQRDMVEVIHGDSAVVPHGGGAWASRGLSIAGGAAIDAAKKLRRQVLQTAASILQTPCLDLDIRSGMIVDVASGTTRLSLAEIGQLGYFQQHLLPDQKQPELIAVAQVVPSKQVETSGGVQACVVEVDVETGVVRILKHIAIVDCGYVVNPLLAGEQVRGGIVQGIGSALYEELVYNGEGQLLNGSLVDYLVPGSAEMPEIEIEFLGSSDKIADRQIKGVGEAGTVGAQAAIFNAVNDALRPLNARIDTQPMSVERVLAALRESGVNVLGPRHEFASKR